jgi:DNA polymerase-3 subunit delta
MQLRADALASHLANPAKGLRPIYTVWGDEPLLAQEAGDAIRAAARAAGYTERQVHTVAGAHFDWSGLLGAAMAMSLFSERQLIEIRIPSGKPGKDGSEGAQRYCQTLSEDVVTLVQLPRPRSHAAVERLVHRARCRRRHAACRPDRASRAAAVDRPAPRRARTNASSRATRASARSRSSPTVSKATCSRRIRKSRSSGCSTRPVRSASSRSNRRAQRRTLRRLQALAKAVLAGQVARALRMLDGPAGRGRGRGAGALDLTETSARSSA